MQLGAMSRAPNVPWTREHLLIALNLYGKLPFGQLDEDTAIIREVAEKMGRSAGSLAMKLSNLASLDPVLKARGRKGLSGASRNDKAIWAEFFSNLQQLAPLSEQLLHDLFTKEDSLEVDFLEKYVRLVPSPVLPPTGPTEKLTTVKQRRGQSYFRQSVLNAYGVRCCISGIGIPRLLVASHIRPWSEFPDDRLNPKNGLCLSSLHDAAFDSGLITLDEKLRVVLSARLREHVANSVLNESFAKFEGKPIRLPDMLAEPAPEFLAHHREKLFQN